MFLNKSKTNCEFCNEQILKEDKAVELNTYENKKVIDERYFHYQCYLEWFRRCIDARIKQAAPQAMKNAMAMLPSGMKQLIGAS